jgi:hypothetical protein
VGALQGRRCQVTFDAALRCAAVVAAVALLAAPYRAQIEATARRALEAGKEKAGLLARIAAAGLILAAAWGKVPIPTMPGANVKAIEIETPSDAMQRVVTPIADALKAAPTGDRMLWAQVWSKAAVVAAGDAVTTEVVFTDTKSLRAFTVIALDIGWRRLGGNQSGKYAGLREATEAAFAQVLGKAEVPVTKDLRERYAELCRAIAWAGVNEG